MHNWVELKHCKDVFEQFLKYKYGGFHKLKATYTDIKTDDNNHQIQAFNCKFRNCFVTSCVRARGINFMIFALTKQPFTK